VAMKSWILFLLPVALISLFAGCGGNSNTQNQGAPPQNNATVTVQITGLTNGSLPVGGTATLTATVQGTTAQVNAGVIWTLSCQLGSGSVCGTLSNPSSASGAAITYTAPVTLSSNSTVVEIVAFAEAQQTSNVVSPITVTTFNSNLQAGTYILQAQGVDPNSNPYQFAAAIVLDGNGNITNGEQNANYASTTLSDANLTGSYFLGNDGRGQITINTNDSNIGQNGVETFAFVYLSPSQALISQVDIVPAQTGTSAQGTMDLQTSTTAPSGGYAFAVYGTDVVKFLPVAFGGVFNIDTPNTISGNDSVVDEMLGKKVNATALNLSGTLTAPDQFGAVTLNLKAPFGTANAAIPIQLTGYIVDDTHIKLIETDTASGNASPFASTGGIAIGQGAATGTFTNNTALSGTYVFNIPGVDLSNANTLPSTLTQLGLFTADNGNLNSGFTDTFLLVNTAQATGSNQQVGAQISASFSGTYSVDSSGTGRATLTLGNFSPDPKHGYTPIVRFYLTGNGNPALVLQGGDNAYPSLGAGIAYPQSTANPAFNGDYGLSFTQEDDAENDGTAQMNANQPALTLSGFADSSINPGLSSLPDQSFGGTFTSPSAIGPFSGTLENVNQSSAFTVGNNETSGFAVNYYFIDPGHGFFVETDLVNSVPPASPPTPSGQVSYGYYATRTPVCPSCP
jgi:hypothetical protein